MSPLKRSATEADLRHLAPWLLAALDAPDGRVFDRRMAILDREARRVRAWLAARAVASTCEAWLTALARGLGADARMFECGPHERGQMRAPGGAVGSTFVVDAWSAGDGLVVSVEGRQIEVKVTASVREDTCPPPTR